MTRVFISYRRDDSADVTGRIFDRLRAHFDKQVIFRDVDVIPFGFDFRQVIRKAVEDCQVLLAVIGPTWLTIATEDGTRRLDDPHDFVRLEIETALKRDIPVIPILVGKAAMPKTIHLPDSLQPLVFRHGLEVGRDPYFHRDIDTLVRGLTELLNPTPPPSPTPPAPISLSLPVASPATASSGDWADDLFDLGRDVTPVGPVPTSADDLFDSDPDVTFFGPDPISQGKREVVEDEQQSQAARKPDELDPRHLRKLLLKDLDNQDLRRRYLAARTDELRAKDSNGYLAFIIVISTLVLFVIPACFAWIGACVGLILEYKLLGAGLGAVIGIIFSVCALVITFRQYLYACKEIGPVDFIEYFNIDDYKRRYLR